MRVGVLCRPDELAWAHRLGFRSVELIGFSESLLAPPQTEWRAQAERIAEEANALGIRISAIGALYRNPLDPPQTEKARAIFRRAIEVAQHMEVPVVAGFAGAVLETEVNERGGNLVYQPFDRFIPQLAEFWRPLTEEAGERGVRLAFEHCPQGTWHLPIQGYNMLAQPALWERFFEALPLPNVGLEWDASHLICQFIDPVENIQRFGHRIFHVHAKDAFINQRLLRTYGICHPGVAEHRFVGLGQSNWSQIVHALLRAGYDGDLNIEGRHDPVFRDHDTEAPPDVREEVGASRLAGQKLEETGLLMAKRTLEALLPVER